MAGGSEAGSGPSTDAPADEQHASPQPPLDQYLSERDKVCADVLPVGHPQPSHMYYNALFASNRIAAGSVIAVCLAEQNSFRVARVAEDVRVDEPRVPVTWLTTAGVLQEEDYVTTFVPRDGGGGAESVGRCDVIMEVCCERVWLEFDEDSGDSCSDPGTSRRRSPRAVTTAVEGVVVTNAEERRMMRVCATYLQQRAWRVALWGVREVEEARAVRFAYDAGVGDAGVVTAGSPARYTLLPPVPAPRGKARKATRGRGAGKGRHCAPPSWFTCATCNDTPAADAQPQPAGGKRRKLAGGARAALREARCAACGCVDVRKERVGIEHIEGTLMYILKTARTPVGSDGLPPYLEYTKSEMSNSETLPDLKGVIALRDIPESFVLGEYRGRVYPNYTTLFREKNGDIGAYVFDVQCLDRMESTDTTVCYHIDGEDPTTSAWPRLVNAANRTSWDVDGEEYDEDTPGVQNCEFFQFDHRMFLRTIRPIRAGREVLAHYGPSTNQFLTNIEHVSPEELFSSRYPRRQQARLRNDLYDDLPHAFAPWGHPL